MKQGALIAWKGEKATLIAAGTDIKKQRQTYRELAGKARHDKGYDRIEWYVIPHRSVRRRPEVSALNTTSQTGNTDPNNPPITLPPAGNTDPNNQPPTGNADLDNQLPPEG